MDLNHQDELLLQGPTLKTITEKKYAFGAATNSSVFSVGRTIVAGKGTFSV